MRLIEYIKRGDYESLIEASTIILGIELDHNKKIFDLMVFYIYIFFISYFSPPYLTHIV